MPFYLPSNQILLQLAILFTADDLAPLAVAVFAGNFYSKVREHAIGRCAMPMLYAGSYVNNVARDGVPAAPCPTPDNSRCRQRRRVSALRPYRPDECANCCGSWVQT